MEQYAIAFYQATSDAIPFHFRYYNRRSKPKAEDSERALVSLREVNTQFVFLALVYLHKSAVCVFGLVLPPNIISL